MLKRLAALIAVPMVLNAQEPGEARIISLDEAIQMAQAYSPAAISARNRVRTSSMAVRGAYLDFLPQLSSSVGLGRPLRRVEGERVWEHSASISANMPLFNPQNFFAVSQSKLNLEAAEVSEITQRYNTSLQVKQQFFNALNARESEAAARAQLRTAEQTFAAARARVRAGSAITSDSLRATIAFQNAQLRVLQAQNASRQASASLTRLVGSPIPVQADPADTANFSFVTIDSAALVAALDQSPTMQSQQITLELSKFAMRQAKVAYWPTLSGLSWGRNASGLGFYGFDDPAGNLTSQQRDQWWRYSGSYTTSISLSIPLWTKMNREDALVSARLSAENAEASFRDQRAQQHLSLSQQIGNLRTTEASIRIQMLSLAIAEEDLRVVQLRYDLGLATLLDVSTSQDALTNARNALISQRHNYRVARAQIEALIGRDLQ